MSGNSQLFNIRWEAEYAAFLEFSILKEEFDLVDTALRNEYLLISSRTCFQNKLLLLKSVDNMFFCDLLTQVLLEVIKLNDMSGRSLSDAACILIEANWLT